MNSSPGGAILRAAGVLVAIAVIGWIDYVTGTEVRVLPLYFVPVGLAAWNFGRTGGVLASALGAAAWALANYVGGVAYSVRGIWYLNVSVQFVAYGVVGLLIAELRRAERYQSTLAHMDALTGLLNRRALYDIGARVMARCRTAQLPVAVAYLDLDGFKAINDTAGHEAGDRLLLEVADRLRYAVRPTDLVARLGGDEFAILLPELRSADADAALERIRLAVNGVLTPAGAAVTVSIGAVGFADPPDHLDGMITRADEALYRAKREGKNRTRYEMAGRLLT